MDLDRINRDPLLARTPLGRLRCIRYGRGASSWVAIVSCPPGRFDPHGPGTIIGTLGPEGDVLAAVFGRRHWEQRAAHERWEAQQVREAAANEARLDDVNAASRDRLAHAIAADRAAGAFP